METFVGTVWYSLLVLLVSLGVGWLADLLLSAWLLTDKRRRKWRSAAAIAESLHGVIEVWGLLLGTWLFGEFVYPPFTSVFPAEWVKSGLMALLILSLTVFAARLSTRLVRATMAREDVPLPSSTIFINLARISVWAIGLTVLLDAAFNIKVSALVAALGVVGLAVSLGLQDTLANLFSGLQIVLSKIIEPDEQIRLSTGEEGTVVDVTWRQTTIENATGDLIIVPNQIIGRAVLTNYSKPTPERTVQVTFSTAMGSDLAQVETLARTSCREGRGVPSGGRAGGRAAGAIPRLRRRRRERAGGRARRGAVGRPVGAQLARAGTLRFARQRGSAGGRGGRRRTANVSPASRTRVHEAQVAVRSARR